MEAWIPSQAANSNTCITRGTQACCDGWSCTLLPVLYDLSGLLQTYCAKEVCVCVCVQKWFAHMYVLVLFIYTQAYTSPHYPSTPVGLGQCCPLDGDSPVRLHLARTHQQGHKVNKRQPLNLVLPDKSPKKTEFVLTQIQEEIELLLFNEVQDRLPACWQ